jgi:hypothetical protein
MTFPLHTTFFGSLIFHSSNTVREIIVYVSNSTTREAPQYAVFSILILLPFFYVEVTHSP